MDGREDERSSLRYNCNKEKRITGTTHRNGSLQNIKFVTTPSFRLDLLYLMIAICIKLGAAASASKQPFNMYGVDQLCPPCKMLSTFCGQQNYHSRSTLYCFCLQMLRFWGRQHPKSHFSIHYPPSFLYSSRPTRTPRKNSRSTCHETAGGRAIQSPMQRAHSRRIGSENTVDLAICSSSIPEGESNNSVFHRQQVPRRSWPPSRTEV